MGTAGVRGGRSGLGLVPAFWACSRQKQGGKEEKKFVQEKKIINFRRPFLNVSQFVPVSLPSSPWIYLFIVLFSIGYWPG